MRQYRFRLSISPEQYEDYYRGVIRNVLVRCDTGQSMQFPAVLLKKFVAADGIHGHFVLVCDENNKCVELRRL